MPMARLSRGLARARRAVERMLGVGEDKSADVPRQQLRALFQRYPAARGELVNLAQLDRHFTTSLAADGLGAQVIELALEELDIARADGRATEVRALRTWLLDVFSAQADSHLPSTAWAPTAFQDSSHDPDDVTATRPAPGSRSV